jgi:hypothetical protein
MPSNDDYMDGIGRDASESFGWPKTTKNINLNINLSLIGFYKHENNGHVWVLEVTAEKNDKEVISFQYQPNQICPISSDSFKNSFMCDDPEFDKPHWIKITEEEARNLIGNLDQQKKELAYRQSEENLKWCRNLVNALKCVKTISIYDLNGVVNITDYHGADYTICRKKDGTIVGEQTGLPDLS